MMLVARSASAQEPPPKIGPFVVDLHATVPMFPSDDVQLAQSHALMNTAELPGTGLGLQGGVHLYLPKWHGVTFGIGGEVTAGKSTEQPEQSPTTTTTTAAAAKIRPVTEQFVSVAPQISVNFGSGTGWSYLSAGIGQSTWSIVPEGQEPFPSDSERLRTIDFGGGARWFAKSHLAFSFDVRFYLIDPGTPSFGFPGSPGTMLLIIGAGVSLK